MVAKWGPLINPGQETSAPVLRAAQRSAHAVEQHNEGRQILILASQAIDGPSAYTGPAGLNESGHHLQDGRRVVVAQCMHRSHYRNVVDAIGRVRKELRDFDARLTVLLEREGTLQESARIGKERRDA